MNNNRYKFYYTLRFILQSFKQIIYAVENGVTASRAWSFTTPHGCWTMTLSCEEAPGKPDTSLQGAIASLVIVDESGVAHVQ